ncbi:MAG: DUF5063 domain-containing protein [Marinilabiliales bacterium]
MEDSLHPVISKSTVEFITVSREYCAMLENTKKIDIKDFLNQSQKILALLYLKASLLPNFEYCLNEDNTHFVTEQDYLFIQGKVSNLLGSHDVFTDVIQPDSIVEDETTNLCLSELFADIYQDLRNVLELYSSGETEIMNDGLCECAENFKTYWGPRLIALLQIIHKLLYSNIDFDNNESI